METSRKFSVVTRTYDGASQNAVSPYDRAVIAAARIQILRSGCVIHRLHKRMGKQIASAVAP
jgi:hypothetical protein